MDRDSGELKASFHYQREIKSGFIYLGDQSDSEDDEEFKSEDPSDRM